MKIIYFSGTGNSLNVCKKIGGELYSIPNLIKNNQYYFKDDKIGIIFPCYAYGMPNIVEEFIKNVKIEASYIFIIVTMGSKDKATAYSCEKLLKVPVNYTNHVAMIDNFVPMYDIKNELKIKDDLTIQNKIDEICKDIENNNEYKIPVSQFDKFLTKITKFIRSKFISKRGDFFFYTNKKCNLCEICLNSCPLGNITINDSKIQFNHNCESCMRCIHICPQNALHVKFEKSTSRLINKHVKIKELI